MNPEIVQIIKEIMVLVAAIAAYWQRMQKRDAYILENLI
jgi:hypothetical protein